MTYGSEAAYGSYDSIMTARVCSSTTKTTYKNDGYGETYILIPPSSPGSTIDVKASCTFNGQCLKDFYLSNGTCERCPNDQSSPPGSTSVRACFSEADYVSKRTQCTNSCNAEDYCCTVGSGGWDVLPCNEGCHIAYFSSGVEECKAECTRGNEASCYYEGSYHEVIAHLGYTPGYPDYFGVGE